MDHKTLRQLCLNEWPALLIGITAAVASSLSSLALMALAGWFLTAMAIAGTTGVLINIFVPSAIIRLCAILRTSLRYAERLSAHNAAFRMIERLRLQMFSAALNLDYLMIKRMNGALTEHQLRLDTQVLESALLREFMPISASFCIGFVCGLWMSFYDIHAALITLTSLTLSAVIFPYLLSRCIRSKAAAALKLEHALYEQASDLAGGTLALKALGALDRRLQRFTVGIRQLAALHYYRTLTENLSAVLITAGAMLAMALVLVIGAPLVKAGSLGGAQLIMLAVAAASVFELALPLALAVLHLSQVRQAWRNVASLLSQQRRAPQSEVRPLRLNTSLSTLELENVSFHYPEASDIVHNLSLSFRHDRNYALVGPSGCGKSTLFLLLCGMLEPSAGKVRANGMDLKQLDLSTLRDHLGIVMQDPMLFSGSIADIFTQVRPKLSRDEMMRILKLFELDEWVLSLPDGLDQWLGSTGTALSGGQARRLACARAWCTQADFLLLDEPGEGLDEAQQIRIMRRLLKARRGLIIITHRYGGLDACDTVITLKTGICA